MGVNGGYVLSGRCGRQQISVKNEGVLIFGGVLIYGVLRYSGITVSGLKSNYGPCTQVRSSAACFALNHIQLNLSIDVAVVVMVAVVIVVVAVVVNHVKAGGTIVFFLCAKTAFSNISFNSIAGPFLLCKSSSFVFISHYLAFLTICCVPVTFCVL